MRTRSGTPLVVTADNRARRLVRMSPRDRRVHESMLQELIVSYPELLPVDEIDEAFGPLITLGREVETGAGALDALFVSPTGELTAVEAKLWRNPEARREVVGQIIDYATALSAWSYERLDQTCRDLNDGQSLWELASGHPDSATTWEQYFVDAVSRNLRTGRFLLLIVGDGIREEVERMVTYVQTAPQLQFTLGLVELHLFEDPTDNTRLVVPSVVVRTTEVERAVVRVDVAEKARVDVSVAVPADDSESSRRRLTLTQFFNELGEAVDLEQVAFVRGVFDGYGTDSRFLLHRRSASVSLRIRHPSAQGYFTVLVFTREGSVYPGWLKEQFERNNLPPEEGLRFAKALSTVTGIPIHHSIADSLAEPLRLQAVIEHWDSISESIDQLVDEIYRGFDD